MSNKNRQNYSILMSVYYKDNPEYLKLAVESMLKQTVKSNDFIIVEDGPVGEELDTVLINFANIDSNHIRIIRNPENMGLGKVLDFGMSFCKNELIARMDSDDISSPTRCERLLELFEEDASLSIAGTFIDEFIDNPNVVVSIRTVPTEDEEIKKYIRRRQPFNHPTVMYKKSEVIRCGGYGPLKRKQDFDLFSRMMNMGCKAKNIPESLLLFRAGSDNFKRRRSREYRKSTIIVAKLNYKRGYISRSDLMYIKIGQFLMAILPRFVLNRLLRKKANIK